MSSESSPLQAALDELKEVDSQREEALARLAQEHKEYKEFLYVASHDLHAPLRKIKAFCERLQMHASDQLDEKSNHYLDRMQVATERLQAMLDGLLILSRVNSRELVPKQIPLNEFLQRSLHAVCKELGVSEVDAAFDVDDFVLLCDTYHMDVLFGALLKNALQFAKEGETPVVRVSARVLEGAQDKRVEIEVADQGVGFDEAGCESIFGMFQRMHRPPEDDLGCGAGLTVSRRAVERHGGTLAAFGKPDEGARFVFDLPLS